MKTKFFILIGVAVLITLAVILLVRREKNINVYEYPDTILVENHTKQKNADTYAKIILNKIYEYDTIKLDIVYMVKDFSTTETEVAGWIQQNPYEPHTYMIFLKKGILPVSMKSFLSHELIQVHQMETGDLIQIPNEPMVIYKGDSIDFHQVPYKKRLFEIEALRTEISIKKKLNQLLYSKNQ